MFEPNQTPAFRSAARLSGALALEVLKERGWSAEELVTFSTAVRGLRVEPREDQTGVNVTLQWDKAVEVDQSLLDRLGEADEELPLLFCIYSGRRRPAEA